MGGRNAPASNVAQKVSSPIHIQAVYRPVESGSGGSGSIMALRIRCNTMELASELVQDLAKFLGVSDLESEVDFPEDFAKFEEVRQLLC